MFMGEMAFLLSNRRSATVIAKGAAVLIKISKQDFVNLIKENPHYGIFLARLLAQRLARLNAPYRPAQYRVSETSRDLRGTQTAPLGGGGAGLAFRL